MINLIRYKRLKSLQKRKFYILILIILYDVEVFLTTVPNFDIKGYYSTQRFGFEQGIKTIEVFLIVYYVFGKASK